MAAYEHMIRRGTKAENLNQWVDASVLKENPQAEGCCDAPGIQALLDERAVPELGELHVTSVEVNRTGEHHHPYPDVLPKEYAAGYSSYNLPAYAEVIAEHPLHGTNVETITVWVPLAWNGRMMGVTGGGSKPAAAWWMEGMRHLRAISHPIAIRNGFVAVSTDGGAPDFPMYGYGFDPETGELDRALIDYAFTKADHTAAVVGKVVTEAIHGTAPLFSYIYGSSGGGRQCIQEAISYPEDYDGVWADSPAINYTRFIMAELWPAIVMNAEGCVLSPALVSAFREAALAALGAQRAYAAERPGYDPHELVGTDVAGETVTQQQADVMQMIWDGPTDATGSHLWWGIRPGGDSDAGLHLTMELPDGAGIDPVPFAVPLEIVGNWVLKQAGWDWHTMDYQTYREAFSTFATDFANIAADDPDLSAFADAGHKLILTHGTDDEAIVVDGSIDYFSRVAHEMGEGRTDSFFRMYPVPGDGHGYFAKNGSGPSLASGMAALMDWVEAGIAPDTLPAQRMDMMTGEISAVTEVAHL